MELTESLSRISCGLPILPEFLNCEQISGIQGNQSVIRQRNQTDCERVNWGWAHIYHSHRIEGTLDSSLRSMDWKGVKESLGGCQGFVQNSFRPAPLSGDKHCEKVRDPPHDLLNKINRSRTPDGPCGKVVYAAMQPLTGLDMRRFRVTPCWIWASENFHYSIRSKTKRGCLLRRKALENIHDWHSRLGITVQLRPVRIVGGHDSMVPEYFLHQ